MNLIEILVDNKEFVAILVALFPILQYFDGKKKEQKQLRFENYHNQLIEKLVNLDGSRGVDQQIAVVYELRNYPEYYPITKRILEGYKGKLGIKDLLEESLKPEKIKARERLTKEMDLTIDFINQNYFKRQSLKLLKAIWPKQN